MSLLSTPLPQAAFPSRISFNAINTVAPIGAKAFDSPLSRRRASALVADLELSVRLGLGSGFPSMTAQGCTRRLPQVFPGND
ncbi:hypothetical protein FRC04_009390 [Tulasnella sp. 424]|nr:hypothetical protein FRC04_009390 [Tulasnella sp. 424]KAG8961884.1 hypothetical protein FRC05_005676 [Tulasnella sp. 425]